MKNTGKKIKQKINISIEDYKNSVEKLLESKVYRGKRKKNTRERCKFDVNDE